MTDVFISYKKQDAGRVIRLVEGLRAEGLTVWWDHGIQAGAEWDRSIHEHLYAARVVIAVWSQSSVAAPWVKEEATVGKTRGVLLPVRIDEVEPPLGFMMIQAADLVGWSGDRADPRWAHLLEGVRAIAGGGAAAGLDAPLTRRAPPTRGAFGLPLIAGLVALLVVVVAAAAAALYGAGLFGSRDGGRGPRVAAPPATPPVSVPAAPVVPAGEQQLWDRAVEEKTRPGFQSYLLAYPNGAYAQRARDILLTCRTETRETWKEGPAVANQMLRGVGDTGSGMSTEQACTKAKTDARALARSLCETIVHNGGFRNPHWLVQDRECDCERTSPAVAVCRADLPYSCLWEMKVAERLEICGG